MITKIFSTIVLCTLFMFSHGQNKGLRWVVEGSLTQGVGSGYKAYCLNSDILKDSNASYNSTMPVVWGYVINAYDNDTADFEILTLECKVDSGSQNGSVEVDNHEANSVSIRDSDSSLDFNSTFFNDLANHIAIQINFFTYGSRTNGMYSVGSGGTTQEAYMGFGSPNDNIYNVGRLVAAECYGFDNPNSTTPPPYFENDPCNQLDVMSLGVSPSDTFVPLQENIDSLWLSTQLDTGGYPYNYSSDWTYFHTYEKADTCAHNTNNKLTPAEANYNFVTEKLSSIIIRRQDLHKDGQSSSGIRSVIGIFIDSLFYNQIVNPPPLPVELISFDVVSDENSGTRLDWATSMESNNSHFVVERYLNNGPSFEPIAVVAGAGTSMNRIDYIFYDNDLSTTNNNACYRLRQVDFDGTFELSDVKCVSIDNNLTRKVVLYPNPATESFNVNIPKAYKNVVEVSVSSQQGKLVKVVALTESKNIDISHLDKGFYIVAVNHGNQIISTQKLLVH